MRLVDAFTVVPDVDAKQVYEPPCVRLILDMIKLLPACNMAELLAFFHVITGLEHPLSTQLRTTGSVSFSVTDSLGR